MQYFILQPLKKDQSGHPPNHPFSKPKDKQSCGGGKAKKKVWYLSFCLLLLVVLRQWSVNVCCLSLNKTSKGGKFLNCGAASVRSITK